MSACENCKSCQEYNKGREDCFNGVPHEVGKGDRYDEGYSEQYAFEQQLTNDIVSMFS